LPIKELVKRSEFLKQQMDQAVGGDVAGPDFKLKNLTAHADQVDGTGRDLLKVLGVASIQAAMDALQARCNDTGTPDFSGLMVGDYLDGLNLSAIPAENEGTAGQAWNDSYKNNRIVLSGFNIYKGYGDTEVTKNHILFTFRNCPIKKRMNPTDDNTGGYTASELRAFLEGANGDGTGDYAGEGTVTTAAFLNALAAQLGAGHLLTIRKAHSKKSASAWGSYTVFLPSEIEVFGYPTCGDEGVYMPALTSPTVAARAGWNTNVHFPIYAKSGAYRIKRYNGYRAWYWLNAPAANSMSYFCAVDYHGGVGFPNASWAGGCAPTFCVC
jgi:hypothetical protein